MGLLFEKYAGPFPLLDGFIQTGRLCEFIASFAEQAQEKNRWEYYLHKVWDKSYSDFCDGLQQTQELQTLSNTTLETTLHQSMHILGQFRPDAEGGE
jgi:hypothetical protein